MDLFKTRRQLDLGKTIFDLPLRVVYYARVSTDRDEQINSLENQITYYDTYIKSNENWAFCGGYVDEGLSGTSVGKREQFLQMIEDAKLDKFDIIITKEISRFSRSTIDSIKYTQDLLDCGVGVFFQSDNINTLYADSELRLTIMSSIAQDEMRRLSERVKFGMKRAYEAGKILGTSNIYGYDKVDCRLIINEEQAKFVRELFELYVSEKYGYRTIARMLNEKGYRNQNGKEINVGTLKSILTNPKYKGYYRGRLTESNDYRTKKNIKLSDKEILLYKDESIPIIIDEETWNKVNEIIKNRTEKYRKHSSGIQSRFPYSGKIKCEIHNTFYYRKVWKDRKIPQEGWCCKEYLAKGRNSCKSPNLYTKFIDSILIKIGEEIIENKEKYQKDIEYLINSYSNSNDNSINIHNEIKKLSTDINKINLKKEKILELYTEGDILKSEFLDTNQKLNEQLKILEIKKDEILFEQTNIKDKLKQYEIIKNELNYKTNNELSPLIIAQNMLIGITVLKESTPKEIKLLIEMEFYISKKANIYITDILYSHTEVSTYKMKVSEKLKGKFLNFEIMCNFTI
jgi:DNA invertase Pin-like site-specific DNA recombinase